MPPERPQPPRPPDPGKPPGQEQPFYYEAARFPTEAVAGLAYFAIQDLIFKAKDEVDLSAYRFQLETLWNVAVLGILPPEKIKNQTHAILEQNQGEFIQLPEDVVDFLKDRREQATQISPWVEGHYHPSTAPTYKRKPKK